MDAIGAGNLVDRALPFDGFERDLCFQFRPILFACSRHVVSPVPGQHGESTTLFIRPVFGGHYTLLCGVNG